MALITDPDLLNQGTEVTINTGTLTVTLNIAGNLSTDGVTLKALYSFLKEEWRADDTLIKFDFPMTPITDEQMQIGVSSRNNGWNWGTTVTRELIRTGGWQEVDGYGAVVAEYTGIISLGNLEEGTQPYYLQVDGGSSVNFVLEGVVNQAVRVFHAASSENFRSFFKCFAREQGDVYAASELSDIGVTTMTFQAYRFPLGTATDIKIIATDLEIDNNSDGVPNVAPYSGMSITYYAAAQVRNIGGTNYNFGIIVDGNEATAEQIYEFVQFQLRQDSDINAGAGTLNGRTADALMVFIGDALRTRNAANPEGGGTGVYIDNFLTADINRISFFDNTVTERQFPFTANLTLSYSATLASDVDSVWRVFFTNDNAADVPDGYNFGTTSAIIPRTNVSFQTTNRARTSNIATITTALAHGLVIGDVVEITDMTDAAYDGVYVLLSVAETTFTYANIGSDEGSTGDTAGTVFKVMGGLVGGVASRQLGYDFDTNVQRGAGSAAEDAPITVVAIGLGGAQYVLATGTIARSTANAVALVAPIERNYTL